MSYRNKIKRIENKQAQITKYWTKTRNLNPHGEVWLANGSVWTPSNVEPKDKDVMEFPDCSNAEQYASGQHLNIGVSNLSSGQPTAEEHWDRYLILIDPGSNPPSTRKMRYATQLSGGLPAYSSFKDISNSADKVRKKNEDSPYYQDEFGIEVTKELNGEIVIWVIGDLDTGGGGD